MTVSYTVYVLYIQIKYYTVRNTYADIYPVNKRHLVDPLIYPLSEKEKSEKERLFFVVEALLQLELQFTLGLLPLKVENGVRLQRPIKLLHSDENSKERYATKYMILYI